MEKFIIGLPINNLDRDSAKLKLALLKENFEFRRFYKEFTSNNDFSYRTETRPLDARSSFDHYYHGILLDDLNKASDGLQKYFKILGFRPENATPFLIGHKVFFWEILILLDPKKDLSDIKSKILIDRVFPLMFHSTGVCEISSTGGLLTRWNSKTGNDSRHQIEPYERVCLIDLRKRKKQLIEEFARYIDYEIKKRSKVIADKIDDHRGYNLWDPDNSRYRKEAWEHLKVWELRKQHKGFSEIANELRLTDDRARKRFYRAYYLTQGKEYDHEILKTEIFSVKKGDPQKNCETCPGKSSCTILCPEILAIVDQDIVNYSREKYLNKDSDAAKDALYQRANGVRHVLRKKPTF